MKEQTDNYVLKKVIKKPSRDIIHYIPHLEGIKNHVESIKMFVVLECFAKSNSQTPSLNECLEIRPPPQALIIDILFRNRIKKYVGLDRFPIRSM